MDSRIKSIRDEDKYPVRHRLKKTWDRRSKSGGDSHLNIRKSYEYSDHTRCNSGLIKQRLVWNPTHSSKPSKQRFVVSCRATDIHIRAVLWIWPNAFEVWRTVHLLLVRFITALFPYQHKRLQWNVSFQQLIKPQLPKYLTRLRIHSLKDKWWEPNNDSEIIISINLP